MDEFRELISCLPLETVEYAFAYGSGALQQKDERKEDKMVDFIVVTNDPLRFHTSNLASNRSHYSAIRVTGPKFLAGIQTTFAARIYCNTQIRVGNRMIKYGVISTEDLQQDLLDWQWLYTAGRLQKPVFDVIGPTTSIAQNIIENRRSALQAALLLLPDVFTPQELFEKVVGLSYTGDFRMAIAEDSNKISKIVSGGLENFHAIYDPMLNEDVRIVYQNGKYLQDPSGPAIYHRLHLLPSRPLDVLTRTWNKKLNRQQDCEEVLFGMAHRHDVAPTVSAAISSIVRPSSISQTAKNALTAGVWRSFIYSFAKIAKKYKSLRV